VVRATWSEVDIVGLCVPKRSRRSGPATGFIAAELAKLGRASR